MERRILLVTTGLEPAGAEIQVFELAKRLRRRTWQVVVVSLLPAGPVAAWLAKNNVSVLSLGITKTWFAPLGWLRLVRFVREFRPTVVHAHMFHANVLARLARLAAPVPVMVCTAHSLYEGPSHLKVPQERTWRELAYRWTDWLCDLTTHVCKTGRARYVRIGAVPPEKIRVVPNGVDTEWYQPRPEIRAAVRRQLGWQDNFVWISIGRLEYAKDHHTLLQAVAQLHQEKCMFILVGGGTLEKELKLLARGLGIAKRVAFLGPRQDVAKLLNGADAFVLSSRWEGLPLALLEAQACGLPVVATQVGGVSEIVDHEQTGLLVPPGDPAALACAMRELMNAPLHQRQAMGANARDRVVRLFSLDRVVDLWETIYMELIEGKRGEGRPLAG